MHRPTSLRLLSLGLAALALVAPVALAEGTPKAVVPEPVKDFEIVPRGDKIQHEFLIRNEGTATLVLTDVRPACGCTVAEFDREIAPGKVGRVHAIVDTATFAGPIAKPISVFTNDAANPKIELVVKAHVKPFVEVLPGYARFNYVQGEEIRSIGQRIWASDGAPYKVVEAKAPYEHLKVSFREATAEELDPEKPAPQYLVDVIIDPWSPIGALTDFVEITLDHPRQKSIKVPISGFVRPRQHVTPDTIDLGQLEGAALPLSRSATFMSFITDEIEVTKVESDVTGLSARVESTDGKGHRFRLILDLSPEVQKGPFAGTVKLHITDAQNPVVQVPVKGVVL